MAIYSGFTPTNAGWWLTYPSEKYVNWNHAIINMEHL